MLYHISASMNKGILVTDGAGEVILGKAWYAALHINQYSLGFGLMYNKNSYGKGYPKRTLANLTRTAIRDYIYS